MSRPDWNRYNNEINRRDSDLTSVWVAPLTEWIEGQLGKRIADASILDFGCGYFDLGMNLTDKVRRIDGYDINNSFLNSARMRLPKRSRSLLFRNEEEIPEKTYDFVVLNSVIQYLRSEVELSETLRRIGKYLRNADSSIVITDILPENYSPSVDAVQSLAVAVRLGVGRPMLAHLWKAATKPSEFSLFRIGLDQIVLTALSAGFNTKILDTNLTPSRQRYSCILTPVSTLH